MYSFLWLVEFREMRYRKQPIIYNNERRNPFMKYCVNFLIIFLFAAYITNGNAQNRYQEMNIMMKELYPGTFPGAALLVMQESKPVISKGYGIPDIKTNEEISPDTHFRMASVSKQFTAMCILVLQKQGKLQLSDVAIKYLPSLPDCAREITIQQLMTHTSGIADYESLIPKNQNAQVSDDDVLKLISQTDSLYFTPGTQFKYSNTGFCLLTRIVEKVSGMKYPEFIRKNIFLPAGMKYATIYDKEKSIFQRAYGYHMKNNQWVFADQSITSATMGDGSVYTSLNEYKKWLQWLWKQKFDDNVVNPFVAHARVKKGLDYGYGWFIARESDGTTGYFHSGESTGFHNIVYHNPSKKFAVVIFSNCDDDRVSKAFSEIIELLQVQLGDIPPGVSLFDFLSSIYGD